MSSVPPKNLKWIRIGDEIVAYVGLKDKFSQISKAKTVKDLKGLPWVDLPKPQLNWTKLLDPEVNSYLARDIRILRDIVLRGLAVGYLQLTIFTNEELKLLVTAKNLTPIYKDVGIYVVYKNTLSKEKYEYLNKIVDLFKKRLKNETKLFKSHNLI